MQNIITPTKTTTMNGKFHLIWWLLLRQLCVFYFPTHPFAHFWLQDYATLQNLFHDTNSTHTIDFSAPVLEDVFHGHMV